MSRGYKSDYTLASTLVWIDVVAARPIELPNWRAELNTAPTVPATFGGVVRYIEILIENQFRGPQFWRRRKTHLVVLEITITPPLRMKAGKTKRQ